MAFRLAACQDPDAYYREDHDGGRDSASADLRAQPRSADFSCPTAHPLIPRLSEIHTQRNERHGRVNAPRFQVAPTAFAKSCNNTRPGDRNIRPFLLPSIVKKTWSVPVIPQRRGLSVTPTQEHGIGHERRSALC